MSFNNANIMKAKLGCRKSQDTLFPSLNNISLSPFGLRLHKFQTLATTYKS